MIVRDRVNLRRRLIRQREDSVRRSRIDDFRKKEYGAEGFSDDDSKTKCLICDEAVPDSKIEAHTVEHELNLPGLVSLRLTNCTKKMKRSNFDGV